MNGYEFNPLPSLYIPTVKPLISRAAGGGGGGSFESGKKKIETLLGLPPLPRIGSLQLQRKLQQIFCVLWFHLELMTGRRS